MVPTKWFGVLFSPVVPDECSFDPNMLGVAQDCCDEIHVLVKRSIPLKTRCLFFLFSIVG